MSLYSDDEDLICPYCKAVQNCHEPDEISSDMCHTECESCGKSFWYSVTVRRDYYPYKDNGEASEEETDEMD